MKTEDKIRSIYDAETIEEYQQLLKRQAKERDEFFRKYMGKTEEVDRR